MEKLLDLLVDESQSMDDPNYVQDFLLTYRTFLDDPTVITKNLLDCFEKPTDTISSEHIARVLLSWVNNHYNDFETNTKLYEFLERFDDCLQNHEDEVNRVQLREARNHRYSVSLSLSSTFDRGDI